MVRMTMLVSICIIMRMFALACGEPQLRGTSASEAPRVIAAYVTDPPAPVGSLTDNEVNAVVMSDFNMLIFGMMNFCTVRQPHQDRGDGIPCGSGPCCAVAGKTIPAQDTWDPALVLNVVDNVANSGDMSQSRKMVIMAGEESDPSEVVQELEGAFGMLSAAGKILWFTFGGASNPETFDFYGSAPEDKQDAATLKLFSVMQTLNVTGIDIDQEAGDAAGFRNFVTSVIRVLRSTPFGLTHVQFSSAPYGPSMVKDQYCNFLAAGVTPMFVNRQYYDGGGEFSTSTMDGTLEPFVCDDGLHAGVSPSQLLVGLGGPETPNGCSDADECADFVKSAVNAQPNIAGVYMWELSQFRGNFIEWSQKLSAALA